MNVYVGLPMYGGAHGLAVRSLLSLQSYLLSKGHTVTFDIVTGGSILPKVRNGIVKRFIDSNADVLLFLDSDMCFESETIEKLINAPFDVSVANYRYRHNTVKYMAQATTTATGALINGDVWYKADLAGTGIMSIKRQAIDGMIAKYPELTYKDSNEQIPCLFDFELKDGEYYGEDYTFCNRLTSTGGQIFILADCYIGHIGDAVYGGNYKEFIRG